MKTAALPTREEILVRGFPEGFLAQQRQRAEVERARAMRAFFGGLWRRLSGAPSESATWERGPA